MWAGHHCSACSVRWKLGSPWSADYTPLAEQAMLLAMVSQHPALRQQCALCNANRSRLTQCTADSPARYTTAHLNMIVGSAAGMCPRSDVLEDQVNTTIQEWDGQLRCLQGCNNVSKRHSTPVVRIETVQSLEAQLPLQVTHTALAARAR